MHKFTHQCTLINARLHGPFIIRFEQTTPPSTNNTGLFWVITFSKQAKQ